MICGQVDDLLHSLVFFGELNRNSLSFDAPHLYRRSFIVDDIRRFSIMIIYEGLEVSHGYGFIVMRNDTQHGTVLDINTYVVGIYGR